MNQSSIIVVGGGPAGLAAARELQRTGIAARILERGSGPGESWRHLYDSLRLHTGKHLSALPGLPFPTGTPLFPNRGQFLEYLESYARTFRLEIETGCEVRRARWTGKGWMVETNRGPREARGLVLATGLISNPLRASWPGIETFAGELIHSVQYRNPEAWIGRRVLVAGLGNSGAEIAAELGEAGLDAAISTRSGAHVMPLTMLGLPVQYWSLLMERLPRPIRDMLAGIGREIGRIRNGPPVLPVPPWPVLAKPPVIGFKLPSVIWQGRVKLLPDIERIEKERFYFVDGQFQTFDAVILATGFRASAGFIAENFEVDERGFPRSEGVRCLDLPHCWVIGHRYAAVGALANIRRDAVRLAREVAASDRSPGPEK